MGQSAEQLIDALAEIIADKVAARLGSTSTTQAEPPAEATPADTSDAPGTAPKRRGRPPKAEKAEEATPPAGDVPADAPTGDMPTEAHIKFIADNVDASQKPIDEIKEELKSFYIATGCEEQAVDDALNAATDEQLIQDYTDYSARLVSEEGGKIAFLASYETPYPATRVDADGTETVKWIQGGVTMSDEEVEKAELGDAAEAAQPPKPKTPPKAASKPVPRPMAKKTTPPGKK